MEPQRAIVAVKWGPLRGRKAVLSPGQTLTFGRTSFADFMVPHDGKMSGVHFEVAWDGSSVKVKGRESATAMAIDGEPGRAEGVLSNGGWIKAGETVFTVHLEGATPPRDEEGEDEEAESRLLEERRARAEAADKALSAIAAEAAGGRIYAVLDAARDERILEILQESVEESASLYDGLEGELLGEAAPHLVALHPGSRLTGALLKEGWGRRWGIFAITDEPFKAVRRHFRRFLIVEKDGTREKLYFRFYDPKALSVFLSVATDAQRASLLGGLSAVVHESGTDVSIVRASGASGPTQGARKERFAGVWKLDPSQLRALEEPLFDDFVDRMVAHFQKHFPEECRDAPVAQIVRAGIFRARARGFVGERDLCLYVGLSFVLVRGFEEAEAAAWARRILDQEGTALSTRLDDVYDEIDRRAPPREASEEASDDGQR